MDKLFNNTWFVKIVSFFIALMLFLMVNMNSRPSGVLPTIMAGTHTLEEVELLAYYNSERYAITEMPETVKVILKGPQSTLTRFQLSRASYEVYVDLAGKEAGSHFVNIQHRGFPRDLSVTIVPQSARVVMQEKKTASLPVEVELINGDKMAEGYTVGTPEVNPKVVSVTAAEDVIKQVSFAKVFIDLEGVNKQVEENVPVKLFDELGNELQLETEPASVDVRVPVQSPFKQVAIVVPESGQLPEGLSIERVDIEQQETKIYGPINILNEIETIETVPLDLSKLTETVTFSLKVQIPSGVERVEHESINVTVVLNKEEVKTFEHVPIRMDNIPLGYNGQFLNPDEAEISVTLRGTKAQLDEVLSTNIQVFVDAQGLTVGEHELPIQTVGPPHIGLTTSLNKIRINIGEKIE